VQDRAQFQVEPASAFNGGDYDLVTMFDCLHDMGDPVGAARHVRTTLKPDGTWMIVEPNAGDRVEENLNPVGRAYYAFSTLLCTPASLSQEVGLALGAQAGEARIRDVVTAAGFTQFRRAAETPFNLVFEARP
jgi:SAM-dependent methyltransferase